MYSLDDILKASSFYIGSHPADQVTAAVDIRMLFPYMAVANSRVAPRTSVVGLQPARYSTVHHTQLPVVSICHYVIYSTSLMKLAVADWLRVFCLSCKETTAACSLPTTSFIKSFIKSFGYGRKYADVA